NFIDKRRRMNMKKNIGKKFTAFALAVMIVTGSLFSETLISEAASFNEQYNVWYSISSYNHDGSEDLKLYDYSLSKEDNRTAETKYISLRPEKTKTIKLSGCPSRVKDYITFRSENSSVATVDQEGNVTGVNYGETWIYTSIKDEYCYEASREGKFKVRVTTKPPVVKYENKGHYEITRRECKYCKKLNDTEKQILTWKKVPNATGYIITGATKPNDPIIIKDPNVTTYTLKGDQCDRTISVYATSKYGKSSAYTIVAGHVTNAYLDSKHIKLKVIKKNKKPQKIQVYAPYGTHIWGEINLQISTDKNFKNKKNIKSYTFDSEKKGIVKNITKYKKNGKTVNLKKNKTYYIRIRRIQEFNVGGRCYSEWTKVRTVKFK
ncbi:MAG: Ig-like domain-containing protein, partial [Pararoseburia sp.]|nr:Ig-like domain-containing protein [Pararoseburia sp.]